jgi:hypothetical protein
MSKANKHTGDKQQRREQGAGSMEGHESKKDPAKKRRKSDGGRRIEEKHSTQESNERKG